MERRRNTIRLRFFLPKQQRFNIYYQILAANATKLHYLLHTFAVEKYTNKQIAT